MENNTAQPNDTGVTRIYAGPGITVSSHTGNVTISAVHDFYFWSLFDSMRDRLDKLESRLAQLEK